MTLAANCSVYPIEDVMSTVGHFSVSDMEPSISGCWKDPENARCELSNFQNPM